MEIQMSKVKEKLKISGKTMTELLQAITNLTRQNSGGRYDERIRAYRQALEEYKSVPASIVAHKPSAGEVTAMMLFNKDRRFTITE
jgi:putative lipoic acid-binding regulatory protein